ncbi:uncharacterized protein RCC_06515 [Ramularia collo-cygni]|uniref:Uncharacterized protein n=1 Tax=Ramularia collo-cygni TaxID=112498 RepID=A0A2D3V7C8_9PEZI|nr:uncharacterized protein RCC_06515 [Ramularia collo-cygni]CZT20657.1 uncharacterized protein RCC_06515 [Ramularia collo-cygni]
MLHTAVPPMRIALDGRRSTLAAKLLAPSKTSRGLQQKPSLKARASSVGLRECLCQQTKLADEGGS